MPAAAEVFGHFGEPAGLLCALAPVCLALHSCTGLPTYAAAALCVLSCQSHGLSSCSSVHDGHAVCRHHSCWSEAEQFAYLVAGRRGLLLHVISTYPWMDPKYNRQHMVVMLW
jgi:hypothetical protein